MNTRPRLALVLLGAFALPLLGHAQSTAPLPPTNTSPTTQPPTANTSNPPSSTAPRITATTALQTASQPVQTAVSAVASQAAVVVGSIDDAIRLGIATPARPIGSPAPASVSALATAATNANNAIVAEDRQTRAETLDRRESSVARLRAAQTDADRRRVIEELRERSGERLDEQRESARLVRDRLRALRDIATTIRPEPR